jgi:foldase protein PrsA
MDFLTHSSIIHIWRGISLEEHKHEHESEHHAEQHSEHHAQKMQKHAVPAKHHKHIDIARARKKKPVTKYILGAVIFVALVAIVVVAILLLSKSGVSRIASSKATAATVNGEKITVGQLEEQYAKVPETYKPYITKSMLLNQTINEVILLQEAKKQGIEVTADDVKKEIDSAITRAGITADQLDDRLKEQNLTRAFLEDLYTKQLTINKLLEKTVFPKIKVTESEVQEFYDSRIHAMHILVETEEEASGIIAQLKKVSQKNLVSKFSELANESSKDPSAATNGGDLGEFGKGQMVPQFEEAAFALDEYGFTLEPVKTQFGYHVILRLPKEKTFEEQSTEINDFLVTQKKSAAVPLYVEQIRSKAEIEVFYKEPAAEPEAIAPEAVVQTE